MSLYEIQLRGEGVDALAALQLMKETVEEGVEGLGARAGPSGERLCRDCDAVIAKNRLRAVPHTVRCVSCQRLYEEGR